MVSTPSVGVQSCEYDLVVSTNVLLVRTASSRGRPRYEYSLGVSTASL